MLNPANVLRSFEPPVFVPVVGKPRTYETDDGDVLVSVSSESITVVNVETRNQWVVETARRTFDRLDGFDDAANQYAAMALERYGADVESYQEAAVEVLESFVNGDETGLNEA